MRMAVVGVVHVLVTSFETTVVSPSSAVAWIVSVPAVSLVYVNVAAPAAFVVPPRQPVFGPAVIENETRRRSGPYRRVATAVTVWSAPVGFVAVNGVNARSSGSVSDVQVLVTSFELTVVSPSNADTRIVSVPRSRSSR